MSLALWRSTDGDAPQRVYVHEPHRLHENGNAGAATSPVVVPIPPVGEAIGAVLIPDELAGRVLRNGIPLGAGLRELRHTDRIEVDDRRFWISADLRPVEAEYDPAIHGEPLYCALSKARISRSEPIVICPGRPGARCGVIYKAGAWKIVMTEGRNPRCPTCGYRPLHGEWKPDTAAGRSDALARLLRIAETAGEACHE